MSTEIQNFYEATITRNWTATTGDFNVSVAPTISEGIIVISPSSRTLREIVRFTATGTNAYGPFVTISDIAHRGLGGTTAQVHSIGEKVRMNITAEHWTEMQDDIDSIVAAGLPAGSEGQAIVHNGTTWVAGNTTGFSDTEVFNGTSPNQTWTDLDLSAVVGVAQKVVLLRFSTTSAAGVFGVKTKGDTKTYTPNSSYFSINNVYVVSNDYTQTMLVKTDINGVIQWWASGAIAGVMIDVLAYW